MFDPYSNRLILFSTWSLSTIIWAVCASPPVVSYVPRATSRNRVFERLNLFFFFMEKTVPYTEPVAVIFYWLATILYTLFAPGYQLRNREWP